MLVCGGNCSSLPIPVALQLLLVFALFLSIKIFGKIFYHITHFSIVSRYSLKIAQFNS